MSIRDVTKQQAAVAAASATDDAPAQRQMGVPGLTQPVPTPTAPPPAPVMATAPESTSPEPDPTPGHVEQALSDDNVQAPTTRVVQPRPPIARPLPAVKAPPAELVVESGKNNVIGVAFSHLNRIITPFAKPVVKTTSVATTSVEGSIVYIATNLAEPVGMFIHDEARPDVAISLTLVPAEMPPVSTNVRIKGIEEQSAPKIAARPTLATAFEQEHSYLDMLKVLFRDLALGRVPDGYGFEEVGGFHPDMPNCNIPGIHVVPLQLVTGASLRAFVARAQNTSTVIREVREDACATAGVRAVAAWPRTEIAPGQAVELYIAVDVPSAEDRAAQRPSLLGGF
jgi:conjugal transfer pilus assembly protein TraK